MFQHDNIRHLHTSLTIITFEVRLRFTGSPELELHGPPLQPLPCGQHGGPAALPEDRTLVLSIGWTLAVQYQRGLQVPELTLK